MISPFDCSSEHHSHVSDDVLTRMISQELSSTRKLIARRHVDRCWQCRARFSVISRSALEVTEYRRHVVERLGPLPSANRDQFIQQLDMELDYIPAIPRWKRLVKFGVRSFGNSAPVFTSALVAICAGLILFAVWRWQPPVVSAAEFLNRAVASEQSAPKISGSRVIHQRFRVKAPDRTIEHDTYRDISGGRHLQNGDFESEDADLFGRLASAGVDWDDLLSAASFKDWHDRQVNPKDEVRSSGDGFLTISTSLSSTVIAHESLTVRQDGFHSVERTIDYREAATVEISEISLDLVSLNKVDELLFEPSLSTHVAAPLVSARALLPSKTQMDETELESRLVLNQEDADTGEQIEITRDAKGIQIQGLVETEERKEELKQSLHAIPFLSVTIKSFDDLKSRPRTTASTQVTAVQGQASVDRISPLEQYFVQHRSTRDDLSRISAGLFNYALAINRSSRLIVQLSLRFFGAEDLSPAALPARDELLSRSIARLLSDLAQQQQLLEEADLTDESGADGPRNPPEGGIGLTRLAELNTAATKELISSAGESERS